MSELYEYQEYTKDFIIKNKKAGIFLDMGMGKSVTTLKAIDDLVYKFGINYKVLIIAPYSVANLTWPKEIQKHFPHLTFVNLTGLNEKKRISELNKKTHIHIINIELINWLVEYLGKKWNFNFLVIDELSAFKSTKTSRFRAIKKILPYTKRIIGLTGTPAANTLMDLFAQMYILDGGKRLGSSLTKFQNTYFTPKSYSGHIVYSWSIKPGAQKAIERKISDITLSLRSKDFLKLPKVINKIDYIDLDETTKKIYSQMQRDFIINEFITADNKAVSLNKLRQISTGAIYDNLGNVISIHDEKIKKLKNILKTHQNEPVILFYHFKHELKQIKKHIPNSQEFKPIPDILNKWNAGMVPLLLAHPKQTSHGLNMQAGGHIIIWYSLSYSLECYLQANARLNRLGQKNEVIIHHLVSKNTIDEIILKSLINKFNVQENLLNALKNKI